MPAGNKKESDLDSEDGTTTRWRGIQRWTHGRFNPSGECCEFNRSFCRPNGGRGTIDAGRGNSRRINATACHRRIVRLFLGTAIVGDRIPRQIIEAYQGGDRGHGNKD